MSSIFQFNVPLQGKDAGGGHLPLRLSRNVCRLTRYIKGAGWSTHSIAHSTFVCAIISGVEFKAELRDALGVRRRGSYGYAVTVPPDAGYPVGIGLQNHTAQIDRLEGRRTDVKQDWIHNRRICDGERKEWDINVHMLFPWRSIVKREIPRAALNNLMLKVTLKWNR